MSAPRTYSSFLCYIIENTHYDAKNKTGLGIQIRINIQLRKMSSELVQGLGKQYKGW